MLRRSLWLAALALLFSMLVRPEAALAQSACTITTSSGTGIPSLTVTRGQTDAVILDTTNASTLAQMRAAGGTCNDLEIRLFNTETSGGTSLNNPVNANLASGSNFRLTAVAGGRQLRYTPSASVASPEQISPSSTTATGTNGSSGTFTNQTLRFYHDNQPAGTFFTVRVTIVSPNAPTAALTSLNPTSIVSGGSSIVTVTLTNPNATAALAGVANSITLPAGVTVAATPGASTTCTSGSITATAGAGTVALSGASMAGGATCTMTFNVTSTTVNTYTIPSGTPSATGANAGSAGTTATLTVTAPPAPTVTAISPTAGPLGGGTSVIITGTNFSAVTGAASVKFGANNATTYTVNSATQITATAPAGGAGTVDVIVTNAGGTSATGAADQYTYVAAPTVQGLAPVQGPTGGGTTVIITGTNLSNATAVNFGATPATGFTVNGATQITATAPAGTGLVDVRVTTVGGTSATSAADQYNYIAAPIVTARSPSSGPSAGGTTVTITGSNFDNATAVTFGATAATGFTVNSNTQITAIAPAGSGTVDIRVTTAGGTSATSANDQFTYIAAPTVNSLSPTSGPAAGGTTVVITGTNLSAASAVSFGATPATSFTVNGATQITATAPAGTGTVDVRVTTAGGTSATGAGDQFTYIAALVVTPGAATGTTVGGSYSQANPASGGTAPYTYALASGGLPAGTTLNTGTGAVTGTPTTAGAYSYAIRATDSQGTPVTATGATVNVTIAKGAQTITFAALANASLSASPLTLSATSSSGLAVTFTSATTGVCSVAGNSLTLLTTGTCTVNADQAGDANYNAAAQVQRSFTVTPATLVVTAGAASGTTVGASYSQANPASGGTSPYTYALASGGLPAGTTLNAATGAVTGTPTTAGAFSYAIQATDSQGTPVTATGATVNVTIAKGAQTITFAALANASLSASPLTLSATSSSGLAIAFTSATTGVCTVAGTSLTLLTTGTCTVNADQAGNANYNAAAQVQRSFTVTPATLVVTAGAASGTTVGASYSQANPASGGTSPYTYALASGAVPAGTTLNTATGAVTGTPTTAGAFSYAIQATDSQGTPVTATGATVSGTIAKGAQTITFAALANASLSASPLTLTATSSAGLAVTFTSATTGVCTVAGNSLTLVTTGTCTVNADQAGSANYNAAAQVQRSFTVTPATLTITPGAASGTSVGASYAQANPAAGGTAPYTYALASGALPTGTTLNAATGTVTGTPTTAGAFTYAIQATDSQGTPVTATGATVNVAIAKGAQTITFAALANASLSASPLTLSATASSGLAVTFTSATTGVCTVAGASLTLITTGTCTVNADQAGNANYNAAAQVQRSFTVTPATLVVTPGAASGTTVGASYSQANPASGGTAPYTYALASGGLPAGTTLNTGTGAVTGTPTTAGAFAYAIQATDSQGTPVTATGATVNVTIAKGAQTITFAALANASLSASPLTLSATSSAGLAITFTSATTGVCTVAGTSLTLLTTGTCTVNADQAGNANYNAAAQVQRSFTVTPATLVVTAGAASGTTVGASYSQANPASGGTSPYTYALASGAVPAGTTLNTATGAVTGTPTTAGAFTYAIQATDSQGTPVTATGATVNVTIAKGAQTVTFAALANASLSASPLTLSATSSAGLAVTFTSATTGVCTVAGTSLTLLTTGTCTVNADQAGNANYNAAAQVQRSFTVTPATLTITPGAASGTTVGGGYAQANPAAGGTAPYTYALASGALPSGTILNVATGAVTGTPSTAGGFTYAIQVTDSQGTPVTATGATVNVTIAKGAQTITFAALANASLSASPLTLSATSSSGLAVTFASATTGVCTVAGTSLTLLTTGTCTVNADQAGNANYNAAAQVQRSFTVTPATLTVTPGAASGTTVGAGYSQTNSATGGTAPYTYALASGALPAGTTLNAATGTVTGTPTTAGAFAYAIQATDSQSTPVTATGATVNVIIAKGAQTITFAPIANASLSASPLTLSATSSVGFAVTFTSATTGVCTVAGTSLTLVATGTCTVNADQAGDANYNAAVQVQRSFTVTPATLTVTPGAASGTTVGTSYAQANPAAGGTAPYSYTLASGALPAGTTLNAATGTVTGTPTTAGAFAYAVQATDSQGTPVSATGAIVNVTIAKGAQTITFAALANASLSASPLTLAAASSSALAVTFTSATTGVCTIAGTSLTLVTTGTCTVNADQPGNGNYNAAAQVQRSFTVTPATLTVAPGAASGTTVGASYAQANPASGGTAPYSYALASGALPTGTTLNAATGAVTGTPTTAGAFSYAIRATDSQGTPVSATGTTVSVTIAKGAQTITFAALADASLSASPLTLTGTSSAGLAVTFTSATTGVCTVAGTSVTLVATGTCTVNADQAGDANYNPAAQVQRSFTVTPATLTVTPGVASGAAVGASYSQANPAAGGTAPYSYALASGALPAGTSLTAATGTVTGTPTTAAPFSYAIRATDSQGTPANVTGTTVSGTIAKGAQTITFAALANASLSASPLTLSAMSSAGLAITFTSATTGFCTVAGNSVTLLTTGTCTVNADQAGDANYNAATQVQRSFTVTPTTLTVTPGAASGTTVGASYSQANPAAGGTAPYAYTLASGALPTGTTLNAATGIVTGTPTTAGAFGYAIQASDSQGTPVTATGATVNVTIAKGAQTLSFTSTAPGNAQAGGSYTPAATASSGLAAVLTIDPASAGICTLNGATVNFTAAGTCAINADQPGNANYNAAARVQQAVAVGAATPAVTSVSPASGPSAGGTSVTITGTNFTGATAVSFGATAAASFTVTSATAITAVTPAGAAGAVDVRVTTAGGTSAVAAGDSFTYVAAPVAADRNGVAIPYNSNGTAIDLSASITGAHTAIAIGTAPAHGTVTVAGDVVTYKPTAGYYGADSFTYTATGPGGTSAPGTVRLTVATPSAPTVANVSANVPYNSTGTAIDLTASITGVHSAIAVATAPTHGTTSVAGDVVTYIPTAGYYGADSFTYTATGPGGTSAPATVTITVATPAAPTVTAASATVTYNTAKAIDLSARITGVHSAITVATAPAHGTTSIAGDVVTYTPTTGYSGADSFTYTATGPGGTSTPATVSLTVTSPALAITPTSLPAGQQDSAYSVVLSASGGAAPYSYSVTGGALPAGLALAPGGTIAGTPTTNGTFAFTVTATDSSTGTPATASQAYNLTIAAPPPPTARDLNLTDNQSITGGGPVMIDLSNLITGNVTDVRVGTAPQHGTVTIGTSNASGAQSLQPSATSTRFVATYTPAAGYRGTDRFTFIATGPGGSAQGAVNITITGTVPTAANLTVTTGQNQPVVVDLTAAATGGPFTQAMIVGVTPAGAAAATLIEGGTAAARTYRLQIVPGARFSGSAVVTYTIGNSFGMSAPATVTVSVTARPNPANDPVVRGLVDAQATVARDFARTQLDNFGRRNQELHGGGGASNPVGVRVSSALMPSFGGALTRGDYDRDLGPEVDMKLGHANEVRGAEMIRVPTRGLPTPGGGGYAAQGRGQGMTGTRGGSNGAAGRGGTADAARAANGAGGDDGAGDTGGRKVGSVAIWSGGGIEIGSRDATTRRAKLDLSSSGLSAGADVKLSDSFVVGLGGGAGHERMRIGVANAGRLTADNWVGALYGSLTPVEGAFIDGVIGYGEIDMNTRRAALGGSLALGHRNATMTFGSFSVGIDRVANNLRYSAYGRIEYLGARLDRYTESGAGIYNLAFDRRRLESVTSVLGGRLAVQMGSVTPRGRVEWRHDFNGASDQALDYADLGGPFTYRVSGDGWLRDEFQAEIGLGFDLGYGWSGGLDIGGRIGESSRAATVKATITGKF